MNNQGKTALLKEKIVLKTVLNTITFIIYSLECWKFGFQFFICERKHVPRLTPQITGGLTSPHPPTPSLLLLPNNQAIIFLINKLLTSLRSIM